MRVGSGFWSNSRLPKEVQTYCTRHIQGDYNTSVSFHTHHAPMLDAPVCGLWLFSHLLTSGARGSPDLLTGCIQWGGEGNSSKPHGWAGALQPCPMHTDTPGMRTPLHHPPTHVNSQMWVQINTWLLAVWPDLEVLQLERK